MQISNYITEARVLSDLKATTKDGVLGELAQLLAGDGGPEVNEAIKQVLREREKLASTGIGGHIAIPHGKLDAVSDLVMGLARSREGVDFESVDGQPAHLFFALVAPQSATGIHLKALARISRLCRESGLPDRLLRASGSSEMLDILTEEEGKFWVQ